MEECSHNDKCCKEESALAAYASEQYHNDSNVEYYRFYDYETINDET